MNEDIHTMFLILFYIYDIIILYFEVQFADGYSVTRECENIWDSTSDSHIVSYDVDTFSSHMTARCI